VIVEYDTPNKDGISKRAMLTQAGRAGPASEPPELASHVWEWFWDLSAARGSNGFGLNPVGFVDLAAWAAMTGAEPLEWELQALREMDRAFLSEHANLKR
jgi:hypothetical protein